MEFTKIRPENSYVENSLSNEVVPLELNLLRTHALLIRYREDLVKDKNFPPNEKLKNQITDLVTIIKPPADLDAEITDDLFNGRLSWWDKLGIVANTFDVEHTNHRGTEERPTAYDVLVELSDSLTSIISDESDHNRKQILLLCEALHKIYVTADTNHHSLYRSGR